MRRFPAPRLVGFATDLLAGLGVPAADARFAARELIVAELEDQPSHGLARLPFVVRKLRDGAIALRPEMTVVASRGGVALLDAGNGLGAVAGSRAMEIAIERAREHGIGACAVRNSNHIGAASFYVEVAAAAGMVGLAFTNTPPALAPPGGLKPYLGTNPIAAAFPTAGDPVIVDMATSQVARGRVLIAGRKGEPIPLGWALDAAGRPTTDPKAALEGSMAPLGGAKGFALALVVEALTGVLAGAGVGPEVGGLYFDADRPSRVGHLLIAIDPSAFAPGFAERMTSLANSIRNTERIDPAVPVRVPGDRRHTLRAERTRDGLDVPDDLVLELNQLAAGVGVDTLG